VNAKIAAEFHANAYEARLWERLEELVKRKGTLDLMYNRGGSGMGFYWSASVGHAWPYCHASTAEGAIRELLQRHAELAREAAAANPLFLP